MKIKQQLYNNIQNRYLDQRFFETVQFQQIDPVKFFTTMVVFNIYYPSQVAHKVRYLQ